MQVMIVRMCVCVCQTDSTACLYAVAA